MLNLGIKGSLFGEAGEDFVGDLRELVQEFDELLEKCMTPFPPMTNEETHTLNELHEALSHLEEEHWVGVNPELYALIQSRSEDVFPTIRYVLGQTAE